jgi:hypothetical protein
MEVQSRAPHRRPAAAAFWVLVLALLLPATTARGDIPLDQQVKGAFIYNFVQFVDWPDKAFARDDDPIVIGVLENEPMEAAIKAAVDGKTVKGRKLEVRRFAADAVGACQVLYLGGGSRGDLVKAQAGKPVLTIGDAENFTDSGGMIRFYVEERKVRFEINQAASERAGLQISAKLLKLAKVVNK